MPFRQSLLAVLCTVNFQHLAAEQSAAEATVADQSEQSGTTHDVSEVSLLQTSTEVLLQSGGMKEWGSAKEVGTEELREPLDESSGKETVAKVSTKSVSLATSEATNGPKSFFKSGAKRVPHRHRLVVMNGHEWLSETMGDEVMELNGRHQVTTKVTMPPAPSVTVGVAMIFASAALGAGIAFLVSKYAVEHGKGLSPKPAGGGASQMNADNVILPSPPTPPSVSKVLFFVCMMVFCGSMIPIANKYALTHFYPVPGPMVPENASYMWTLMVIQFLVGAIAARAAGWLGICNVTPLTARKAAAYFPAASMFMITLVAGNAVMNFSSVNAFLVLRSLVPLPCSLAETLIYRDSRPPATATLGLLIIATGAIGYSHWSGPMQLTSIPWALLYLILMPVDGLLIKHSMSSLDITPVGFVYYNNILALLPATCMMYLFETPKYQAFWNMIQVAFSREARVAILCSCLLGFPLSYFQLRTRYFLSAAGFLLLGVVSKFATILINNFAMQHEGFVPVFFIILALSGAVMWQVAIRSKVILLREGSDTFEKNIILPVAVASAALMWAAYVEWRQVVV